MSHACEFDGCTSTETSAFIYHGFDEGDDVATWLCWEHASKEGFCPMCGCFVLGGSDDYTLGEYGVCADCVDELKAETGECDDDSGDWNY